MFKKIVAFIMMLCMALSLAGRNEEELPIGRRDYFTGNYEREKLFMKAGDTYIVFF